MSSKLYAGKGTVYYKLPNIVCDNPKQNQLHKRNMLRQEDNNNSNNNPSNNSDILVHLADIKGGINSVKTSMEDAFARTFKFFE